MVTPDQDPRRARDRTSILNAWLDELGEFDVRIAGAVRQVAIAERQVVVAEQTVEFLFERRRAVVAALRAAEKTLGVALLTPDDQVGV